MTDEKSPEYARAEIALRKIACYVDEWRMGDNALHAIGHIELSLRTEAPPSAIRDLPDVYRLTTVQSEAHAMLEAYGPMSADDPDSVGHLAGILGSRTGSAQVAFVHRLMDGTPTTCSNAESRIDQLHRIVVEQGEKLRSSAASLTFDDAVRLCREKLDEYSNIGDLKAVRAIEAVEVSLRAARVRAGRCAGSEQGGSDE